MSHSIQAHTTTYKGYRLTAVENPPKWNVAIDTETLSLPAISSLLPSIANEDMETAIGEARRRIDEALATARAATTN
jgi:hypothetical protein